MGLFDYKKAEEPRFKLPKKVQDAIEIEEVYESGIFRVSKTKFSKTYLYYDINYLLKSDEEQERVLNTYCNMLNSLEIDFKITINNKNRNMTTMRKNTLMKLRDDGYDEYRQIYNEMIETKIIEGKQGVEQQKYITISVNKKNVEEAKLYFNVVEATLKRSFTELGTVLMPLNAIERMRILHDFYRIGNEETFNYDFEEFKKHGRDVIDYISPGLLNFKFDHFQMNDKVCRMLFIKDYGTGIPSDFITKLTEIPGHMMLSIEGVPVPKDVAYSAIHQIQTRVEEDIIKEQQVRNKQGNYSSDISYQKRKEKADTEELMNDMDENNEKLFWMTTLILLIADSKEKLEQQTDSIMAVAAGSGCQIEKHYFRQRRALNTVLPIGVRQVNNLRIMQSTSLTGLVPFNVQEIYQPSGRYYGINEQSKNIIKADRKRLKNGNGFIFGVSGSGKSVTAKDEISKVYLDTDDDIIAIDPEGEYSNSFNEFDAQEVIISPTTKNYINPFEMSSERVTNEDITNKTDFVLSIIEQSISGELSQRQKSIISRVTKNIYKPLASKKTIQMPTMADFYKELQKQKEPEAEDLALCLEIFVEGSLNIFAHHTNVDMDKRFIIYNIKDLGRQLASIGMFVMLEKIASRIEENKRRGKNTWLYIDEFYILFEKEYSAEYFYKLWKRIRKCGGFATGITQNVEDVLQSYRARTMLANSEFVILLKQAPSDIARIGEVLNISDAQLKYVEENPRGTGLIKFGSIIIPFDNRISEKSKLYEMFNTDPNRKEEAS